MRSIVTAIVAGLLSTGTPSKPTPYTQAAEPGEVVLSEVLYALASGDTAFIELANVGRSAVDLGSMVLRIDTMEFPLPRLQQPIAPGARAMIRFDGRSTIEGSVVHTAADGLNPESGEVVLLRNDDYILDRIAWGSASNAFRVRTGGLSTARVDSGSSIGRPPGANRSGTPSQWVAYRRDLVTPGTPNPMPPVLQGLPMDGAIREPGVVRLSWYPVPGATRYRVQLGTDSTFRQPSLDRVVSGNSTSAGQLAVGVYWWRIQAMGADSTLASWSFRSRLEIASPDPGAPGFGMPDLGAGTAPPPINVPLLIQHKDTRMLLLESYQEGYPRTASMQPRVPHTWDRDHGTLDEDDPADNTNCALASMAMLNRHYGGDLSQDRLGYEIFSRHITQYAGRVNAALLGLNNDPLQEVMPGPEYDLMYGDGSSSNQILAMGLFALGALPGPGSGIGTLDEIWDLAVSELESGRPLMAFNCCHAVVVRGYARRGDRRILYINDPWDGRYAFDLDAGNHGLGTLKAVFTYPSHPNIRRQEPSVTTDSDGDGVYDFDEVNRFRTNPRDTDTDGDLVPDKRDIASGIYEAEKPYGYAFFPVPNSPGRDYDQDGMPSELDADSDNGGCHDGREDVTKDGIRHGEETSNFDETDDVCGNLVGSVSYMIEATNDDPSSVVKVTMDKGTILVKLTPEAEGSRTYIDNGSSFTYQGFARLEIPGPCLIWARELARGSGPFRGEAATIGATKGDDHTLAFGANADIPSVSVTGGCSGGEGASEAHRALNFPDCTGRLAPPIPGRPAEAVYRFNCTTRPDLGPGWTVTRFYARGYIKIE